MQLANMFKKGINLGKNEGSGKRMTSPEVPEGILKKCNACKAAIFTEDVKKGYYICPKCGSELVLRTANKGKNAGKCFWGCSGFPKCKYTQDID